MISKTKTSMRAIAQSGREESSNKLTVVVAIDLQLNSVISETDWHLSVHWNCLSIKENTCSGDTLVPIASNGLKQ